MKHPLAIKEKVNKYFEIFEQEGNSEETIQNESQSHKRVRNSIKKGLTYVYLKFRMKGENK
jgi:hypothetical protein